MQQRYYDPIIGRFYSNDPVGFKTSNPMMFNRYAYANNNPYKYVDPDGRCGRFAGETGCGFWDVTKFSGPKSGLQESPLGDAWREGSNVVKSKTTPPNINYTKLAVGSTNGVRAALTGVSARTLTIAAVFTAGIGQPEIAVPAAGAAI